MYTTMRLALTGTMCIIALAVNVLVAAAPQPVEKRTGMAIPITKRSSLVNPDMTVNIKALNAHVASVNAKILHGLDKYEKNTGAPHPAALTGKQNLATRAIPLVGVSNELWYGNISVGTPSSTFIVDFDTGSSDIFLPGPNCTVNCNGHTIYKPGSSESAHDMNEAFTLEYGYGSFVRADEYTESVTVAGLTALNQTLGVGTQYSTGFSIYQFPADGLLGMAFQSMSIFHASPVFQTLVSQGTTNEAAFSFKLASSGSELYVGGANSDLYTGDFTYTPVTQEAYWEINMGSVLGNGQTILSNISSFIDTGTSLVIGQPSEVAQLSEALGGTDASSTVGNGYYTFPCNAFPSVSFTFGGTSFPISVDSLNLGKVSSNSTQCVSGIVGGSTPSSLWVIGDVFLLNVYTKFDVGKSQVGFAQLA